MKKKDASRKAPRRAGIPKLAPGQPHPDHNSPFCSIPDALKELRDGRFVILVDDEDRENEGDLVIAAEKVTPAAINFMSKHARGLICLALTEKRCDELQLPLQASVNTARFGTAFTVSIEARTGVTTGISAADRAHTIRTAVNPRSGPEDLARPGHVFPLRARDGGVLVRAGQTEGSVDLCRLAGMNPAGVICEIMNDDGTMARLSHLELFAAEHNLKIISIRDLIEYRRATEKLIERAAEVSLPTRFGTFKLYAYVSKMGDHEEHHLAMTMGDIRPGVIQTEPILVRVHSECLTGDALGSLRCDCGPQLAAAQQAIAKAGKGTILYMRQEGRGIGLVNKLKAYELQEKGHDTVQANVELGFKPDLRRYGLGAQMLVDLGIRKIRLLTNNPRKIVGLGGYGLEVVDRVPIQMPAVTHNKNYLSTKKNKLGHLLEDI
ncbi:MAG TPA: bifunctional 3,4-dihydroxy-2-butanone-4-phosphate synthase/GTP cyclohydrolase II [Planctomycetota bacterium]|nr:bifunctional 3,4-dihydroxy-2-butanone-4-phosphate synthase/GTP cyclohydrolase II [Planctomycetota bacterium]